jgi:hypothetical protein
VEKKEQPLKLMQRFYISGESSFPCISAKDFRFCLWPFSAEIEDAFSFPHLLCLRKAEEKRALYF